MGRPPKKKEEVPQAHPTKDRPWDEAIQKVLTDAGEALHYAEIARRIADERLRSSIGATPAQTVANQLSASLRDNNSSPYLRVGSGEYTLKATAEKSTKSSRKANNKTVPVDSIEETGALQAFGMYWRRDVVFWTGTPKLLGKQSTSATDVNFADQIGIYLIHDRERVIYVGRAVDTLFGRLKAHTTDRLSGRWDRFSWFGLRNVGDNGELSDNVVPWSQNVVVETMEALLIESLEPPLNRRRGDNFSGAEYIQSNDPRIETAKKKEFLAALSKNFDQE